MREFFPSIEIDNGSRLIYSSRFVYKIPPELYRACMNSLLYHLPAHSIDTCMQMWMQNLLPEVQDTIQVSEQLV